MFHKVKPLDNKLINETLSELDNEINLVKSCEVPNCYRYDYSKPLPTAEDVPALLDEYVYYFNNRRPAAALGYKSPVQYKTELGF